MDTLLLLRLFQGNFYLFQTNIPFVFIQAYCYKDICAQAMYMDTYMYISMQNCIEICRIQQKPKDFSLINLQKVKKMVILPFAT